MTIVGYEELNSRYENFTSFLRVEGTFTSECVGGQPADEAGLRAFVEHQLKITDPAERDAAVRRIMHEELEDVTPVEGELHEQKTYGVRAIRRTNDGYCWLGDWMAKAMIKQAASRLYVFQQLKAGGAKGAFAEAGRVRGWKYSLRNDLPNHIYVLNPDLSGPAETYYRKFMGRVQTPQGPVSIIHDSECIAPGSRFAFEFRFMPVKGLGEDVVKDVIALIMIIGLGSARSLECGKFQVNYAELELAKLYDANPEGKKDKKEKKALEVPPPASDMDQPIQAVV